MPELIIQLIIVLLVCGFLYWAFSALLDAVPFIAEPFKTVIRVLMMILVGAIILFYAIIPLLKMLPRLLH
jgi:hypothetical protein